MHKKELLKKGFKSYAHGTKKTLEYIAQMSKKHRKIKNYRIVKCKNDYELYVRY